MVKFVNNNNICYANSSVVFLSQSHFFIKWYKQSIIVDIKQRPVTQALFSILKKLYNHKNKSKLNVTPLIKVVNKKVETDTNKFILGANCDALEFLIKLLELVAEEDKKSNPQELFPDLRVN